MTAPALLSAVVPIAAADAIHTMSDALPEPWDRGAVFAHGGYVYVLGGYGGTSFPFQDRILRYDPTADAHATMDARLTGSPIDMAYASDGNVVYLFGGDPPDAGADNRVYRYDPDADVVSFVTTMPAALRRSSAVWTGTACYVFGGVSGSGAHTDRIYRFDPVTETFTEMASRLPGGRDTMGAVWDGSRAYLFGGETSSGITNTILRFDPATDTISTASAVMPTARYGNLAVWTGSRAVVFGGILPGNPQTSFADVLLYDPAADVLTTSAVPLPTARWNAAPAFDGDHVYVFGGDSPQPSQPSSSGSYLREIVRYTPDLPPGAPRDLAAVTGPGAGEITLTWTAPAKDGGVAITAYEVHRGEASGTETLLTTLGNVLTFRDTGLGNGVTKFYTVRARNAIGAGPASNEASATTGVPPSAPRGLAAVAGPGAGEISLSWTAPANDGGVAITAYEVHRGDASGTETLLTTLGNVLTFRDTGLGNGVTKFYAVRARNAVGTGAASNEASATTGVPPSAPRNLTATTELDVQHVDLAWEPPADDGRLARTEYVVYRTRAVTGGTTDIRVPADATSYRDLPPEFGVYEYAVTAVNPAGESPRSNEECAVGGRIASESPAYVQAMMASGCPAT